MLYLFSCSVLFLDLSSRGKLKFGDPCETTQQCGFVGSVCLNRECVCEPFLEATNHFDKCGKRKFQNSTLRHPESNIIFACSFLINAIISTSCTFPV